MKETQFNLAVITTFSALVVPNVFAQKALVPQVDTNIETIQLTGSRINRTDMETASPVTIIFLTLSRKVVIHLFKIF